MRDRIILHGMSFWGYHGARPEENTLGQTFVVDLELTLDLRKAGQSDDLANTVHYGQVYQRVEGIMTGKPVQLIETLAERVAQTLLADFPVEAVLVRVKKPHVPIPGHLDYAAVEVYREGNDTSLSRSGK